METVGMKRIQNYLDSTCKENMVIFILLSIVLPILGDISIVGVEEMETIEWKLQQYLSFFYSASIVFLFVIVFLPYIGEDGREVLYLQRRIHFFEVVGITSFLVINLLATCCWWKNKLETINFFYIKNFIMIVCFSSLCYFLIYVFKNITVFAIIAFCFFLVTFINPFGLFYVNACNVWQSGIEILCSMWEYLLMIVICLPIGLYANWKYSDYSI